MSRNVHQAAWGSLSSPYSVFELEEYSVTVLNLNTKLSLGTKARNSERCEERNVPRVFIFS